MKKTFKQLIAEQEEKEIRAEKVAFAIAFVLILLMGWLMTHAWANVFYSVTH